MKKGTSGWSLLLFALVFSTSLHAGGKSYTKSDLKKLIGAGKFPKTENPSEENQSQDFVLCHAMLGDYRSEKEDRGYPTRVIKDKKDHYVIRAWIEHMMIEMTCKDGNLKRVEYDYSY